MSGIGNIKVKIQLLLYACNVLREFFPMNYQVDKEFLPFMNFNSRALQYLKLFVVEYNV